MIKYIQMYFNFNIGADIYKWNKTKYNYTIIRLSDLLSITDPFSFLVYFVIINIRKKIIIKFQESSLSLYFSKEWMPIFNIFLLYTNEFFTRKYKDVGWNSFRSPIKMLTCVLHFEMLPDIILKAIF